MTEKLQIIDVTVRLTIPHDSQTHGRAEAATYIKECVTPDPQNTNIKIIGISAVHVETRPNG